MFACVRRSIPILGFAAEALALIPRAAIRNPPFDA
jgi:hypothetical protein